MNREQSTDEASGGLPRLVREDGTVYLRVRKTLVDMHIVAFIVAAAAIALIEVLSRTGVLFN